MSTVSPKSTPAITGSEDSGRSHVLLILVPPAIGYLASVLFVIFGPFNWWANYLVAGAVWGISQPLRTVSRIALKHIIAYKFRSPESRWVKCVKDDIQTQLWQWRSEPLTALLSLAVLTVVDAATWPIMVCLGVALFS